MHVKDLTQTEQGRVLYTEYLERYLMEVEFYQKEYDLEQERLRI